jgi:hypothetical protein
MAAWVARTPLATSLAQAVNLIKRGAERFEIEALELYRVFRPFVEDRGGLAWGTSMPSFKLSESLDMTSHRCIPLAERLVTCGRAGEIQIPWTGPARPSRPARYIAVDLLWAQRLR